MTIVNSDLVEIADTEGDKGIFDSLMCAVEASLLKQSKQGHITDDQYAEVYLGLIQSAMSQGVAFLLGKPITNAQAAYLNQQTLTEEQNTLKVTAELGLIPEQIALIVAQTAEVVAQTALIGKKELTEIQNTLLVIEQTGVATAQEAMLVKQALTEVQNALLVIANTSKTDEEKNLLVKKVLTEVQNTLLVTSNVNKTDSEKIRVDEETDLLQSKDLTEIKNALKVQAEVDLLDQKKLTEEAQTKDTLSDATVVFDNVTTPGSPVGKGLSGKQQVLYFKQAAGFDRDAEQKILKIMMDGWAIGRSTAVTGSLPTIPAENESTAISATLGEAKTNAGLV